MNRFSWTRVKKFRSFPPPPELHIYDDPDREKNLLRLQSVLFLSVYSSREKWEICKGIKPSGVHQEG